MTRRLLLVLAVLVQMILLAAVLVQEEVASQSGVTVQVPARPVDPFDPFRGRYVVVHLALPPVTEIGFQGQIYARVSAGDDKKIQMDEFSRERPGETNHYLEVLAGEADPASGQVSLELAAGNLKVYLPEALAPEVEALMNRWDQETDLVLEGQVFQGAFRPLRFLYQGKEVRLDNSLTP